MLDDREKSLLKQYCGGNILTAYLGLEKQDEQADCVRIVNTGMVSSGKSSIYNALIEYVHEEKFPTGAARTTIAADEFTYGNNVVFVDTPGIDVRTEDDEVAFETISSGDLIVMVHNIKDGELKRSEIEWIERLLLLLGSERMQHRFVFIGSWVDTRDRDTDYQDLINTIKKMLLDYIGVEIPFFEISAKRYHDGKLKGKQKMIEKSGVDELRKYLLDQAAKISSEKESDIRKKKLALRDSILLMLEEQKIVRCDKIEEIKKEIGKSFDSELRAWTSVFNTYKELESRLEKLKKELKSI